VAGRLGVSEGEVNCNECSPTYTAKGNLETLENLVPRSVLTRPSPDPEGKKKRSEPALDVVQNAANKRVRKRRSWGGRWGKRRGEG